MYRVGPDFEYIAGANCSGLHDHGWPVKLLRDPTGIASSNDGESIVMFRQTSQPCIARVTRRGSVPSLFECVSTGFVIGLLCGLSTAQPAVAGVPGEDPIMVIKRIAPPMGPALASARSTPMSPPPVAPAWLEAKVARLEAKAWGLDTGNLLTDRNVLASASSDGLRKVCVQDIGSAVNAAGANSGAGANGLRNTEPQIVVLKGDLVNICR